MKIFLSLLIIISTYLTTAQNDSAILLSDSPLFPRYYCGNSSPLQERKVDSLFSKLNKLADSLSKLEFEATSVETNGYVFLFVTEFTESTVYFEFPQPYYHSSYSQCITDSLTGKKDQWNLFSKDTSSYVISSNAPIAYKYGSTFLTISKTTHYSANNKWWTTQKYYLIREDEYLNYIQR